MKDDMSIKLHHAVLPAALKGTMTKPPMGIDDSRFQYVSSLNTDLATTFARIFGEMGERKVEKV